MYVNIEIISPTKRNSNSQVTNIGTTSPRGKAKRICIPNKKGSIPHRLILLRAFAVPIITHRSAFVNKQRGVFFMPSYEKSKASGLWSARFRETDELGNTKQKRLSGFKTKKEAQYGYEDYIKAKENKAPVEDDPTPVQKDLTFPELYEAWLRYKASRTKATSYYDVRNKCNARILPYFKNYVAKDITPAIVLEWQLSLDGFSYAYKKTLMGLLSSIFGFGQRYHGIKNVVADVDKPRNLDAKKEMQIWSPEELKAALEATARDDMRILWMFLYFSGCRRGEALALKWSDIDLDSGTVSITKSVTNKQHDGDKPYALVTPKTKSSIRDISIPSQVVKALSEYRRKAAKNATEEAFVFGGERPIPFSTIERKLKEATEAAGVKKIRMHDFRHSCASLLISSGVSIVAVSRHLGHKNIEETLNTYAHLLPDDRKAIRNALENASAKLGTKLGTKN